ncbi:MAG: flagellar biosynthesis regulator FlaF [Rubellimicrobium sp.]|nr:flagellar biosynthesis regulator FlaF [Rubellimicrobium sp.]
MNPILQARQAYAPGHGLLRSARSAELQIIGEVTARLTAATRAGFPSRAAAIHDNRKLWTRLAADVADNGNGLPAALRAQIFYLAEFTEAHSRRVLRGEADLDALIEINVAVMRGLGGRQPGPVPS